MKRRVVVTGVGIITAHGVGKEVNWTKTMDGASSVQQMTFFDSSRYRGKYGCEALNFTGAEIKRLRKTRLDRASHLLIHAAHEALEDSSLAGLLQEREILISVGTTLGGMISGERFHREALEKGLDRAKVSRVLDYLAHSQLINLFKELKIRGDYVIFTDACASSTNAIGHAFHAIRYGSQDISICGGYEPMTEFTFAGFNSLMAVAPECCRPFDRDREGLVLGEGAAILILEEFKHARQRKARILCEMTGFGRSSDAFHMTKPEPSGQSTSVAITQALKEAGYPKIDYINAHGTGTKDNDVMEAKAIAIALGNEGTKVPVSSTKPMIGHLLGAAGAAEAVLSVLAIVHGGLPPNINYRTPDPEFELNIIREPARRDVNTVLSNSFGFGGSNACLIMEKCP